MLQHLPQPQRSPRRPRLLRPGIPSATASPVPSEKVSGTWRLQAGQDVTQFWFDRIDLDTCTLQYEGTGGTSVRRWRDGQCNVEGETLAIRGKWLGSCFGMSAHPPWCDPSDPSDNETVAKTVSMKRVDACTLELDGFTFESLACVRAQQP